MLLVAKPGIVFGNLISAAAGFFLASKGRVDGVALPATLIGISLVVASGCVFNNCIDRNIDRKMLRTRNRALAQGLISLKIRRILRHDFGHGGPGPALGGNQPARPWSSCWRAW